MAIERLNAILPAAAATRPTGNGESASTRAAVIQQPAASVTSAEDVKASVQQLQAHLNSLNPKSEFRVDYLSGLDVVTVRTTDTGEIIRQIPSAQAVNLARLISQGGGSEVLASLDATV